MALSCLAGIYALFYSFLRIGNTDLTFSMASGDDDIPFYVDYRADSSKYKDDVFAQTIMSYSWTSWIRFLPPVVVQLSGLSPTVIHIFIVVLQNSLILLGVYFLALSMKVPHNVSFLILLIFSLIQPYLFNLSWSGDLEWMPFATWIGLGIGLFAIAFNFKNYTKTTFLLIFLMSFTQISMAVSCLLLILFTGISQRNTTFEYEKYLLYISGLIPFVLLSLVNNKEEFFSDSYVSVMKTQMLHWSAWNFSGPAFNVSTSFLIFTISTSTLLLACNKYENMIKGITLAIVLSTTLHVVCYKLSYIDGMRLNLTRITLFTSIILFIASLDFLSKDALRGKTTTLSQVSLFVLMCFHSIVVYPIITLLYFFRSYRSSKRVLLSAGTLFVAITFLYLQLSELKLPELFSRTLNTILSSKTPSTFNNMAIVAFFFLLLILSRNLSRNSHLSLVIVCGIIFSLNSSNEYKVYFQSRQSAVIHQSEVQIWARENTPSNSKFILNDVSTWGSWRNNSLRSVVSQDIVFHPYSHTLLNVRHNSRLLKFLETMKNRENLDTYGFYREFAREFGGDYLVARKSRINGKIPVERLRFENEEFVVIELE